MIRDINQGIIEVFLPHIEGDASVEYAMSVDEGPALLGDCPVRLIAKDGKAASVAFVPIAEEHLTGKGHSARLKISHGDATLADIEFDFAALAKDPLSSVLAQFADGAGSRTEQPRSRGEAFHHALNCETSRGDYIFMAVIDWDFRIQRPQHLARCLAEAGHRVFYLSVKFCDEGTFEGFRVRREIDENIYEVQLALPSPEINFYAGFGAENLEYLQKNFRHFTASLKLKDPRAVLQYPTWFDVVKADPGVMVIHDCLDHVGGFSNVPDSVVETEERLVSGADLVLTTSKPLYDMLEDKRVSTIVRNAGDVDFFAARPDKVVRYGDKITIGYFGAISDWFDLELVHYAAKAKPEWQFVLIGNHDTVDVSALRALPNVELLGERPYQELPSHLHGWDVATIPFIINDLIRCTNPVKVYEYFATGIPVVATAMPEVIEMGDLAYVAENKKDFVAKLEQAVSTRENRKLRKRRQKFADTNTWQARAAEIDAAVVTADPKVSIVMLAYNGAELTRNALKSFLFENDYANCELIVVDNASTDETEDVVADYMARDNRISYIKNDENLGFSAGNNVGMDAATGDYVILLNNDTYLTRGSVRGLIRPMMLDQSVGLVGPLTNNIGNEQKIAIDKPTLHEALEAGQDFVHGRARDYFDTDNLAFFCVAMSRAVIDKVGGLDEAFGRGFFEDDDYCRRVMAEGYRLVIADEVFIYHHLSASFNAIGSDEKQALFERNKAIFEEKWGEWKPHKYRDAPGFG